MHRNLCLSLWLQLLIVEPSWCEPVTPVELPSQEQFHLFLLVGQSNMAGRGQVTPQDEHANPRVLMFTREDHWAPAIDPLHFDKPGLVGVGPGRSFGIRIAETNPGITVGLIPCAVGGSAISSWEPGGYHAQTSSHPYDDAVRRAKSALQSGTLKGILWHQGESDCQPQLAAAYERKLHALVQRLREDLGAPDAPFIVGQMGHFSERPWDDSYKVVDSAHRNLRQKIAHCAYVSSEGLAHKGDQLHFSADASRRLGERLADAFLELTVGATINENSETYDSHPSAAVSKNGSTWVAWHGYRDGRDRILARRIDANDELGQLFTVSEKGDTHGPPSVVSLENDACVCWSAHQDGTWSVISRRFTSGSWQPAEVISASADAIHPVVAHVADEKVIAAWASRASDRFQIHARLWNGRTWQPPMVISSGEFDAQRPTLAVEPDGQVSVFWDRYDGTRYSVQGRIVWPEMGPLESISPVGQHCLTPTALATAQGLVVAWLQKTDVLGGPGVISQWHTLHGAIRTSDGWSDIVDPHGSSVAAELTQGLMAKITPQPVPTGGYLGRRTTPMLVEANHRVWLLWERKSDHQGATWRVRGDLLGRPIENGRWQTPVTVHRGLVDYHTIHSQQAAASRFPLLASRLPRHEQRIYQRIVGDVSKTEHFQQDTWEGWSPVKLPLIDQRSDRHRVNARGAAYQLFWGDLHCHSGLTADAEGEADELMHYARDRACLDLVVFTNNDFIYDVPLTQYEFAMSNFLARVYTRSDFLALPGFEWTSRLPLAAHVPASQRGNWTPPYLNSSYPNHRSVIYPVSGGPLLHYPETANNIQDLNSAVDRAGGVTLTQHEAFQPSGHPVEVAMELTSGWRRYITRRPELFHGALREGLRLGFVASGDTHRRAPGLSGALTGIYAEELTSQAVLDALRARRCFATSGSRIVLDTRANGELMGSHTSATDGHVHLTLQAIGTDPIAEVTLMRNGTPLRTFDGGGSRDISLEHEDHSLPIGTHWYYWRVAQVPEMPDLPGNLNPAFGHLAWSSPHWVTVEERP